MPAFVRRFLVVLACAAAAAGGASAETVAPVQSRKPTGAELSSFARFFQHAYPDAAKPPLLSAWRRKGDRSWQVESAEFELPPSRATGALCTSEVVQFQLDGQWRESAAGQKVWLDCASQAARVKRAAGLADSDAIRLLERQQALLSRARLLMAGNTYCAKERSSRFALASIAPQAANKVVLEFNSDRKVVLTVGARKSGIDFDVLDVHCTY